MKKMLYSASLIAAMLFSNLLFAQDCNSGDRYKQAIFSSVDVTTDIKYGENINMNSELVELLVDIYEPSGDTDTDRPLILLAHGGSFIGGDKGSISGLCEDLAKLGYVVASMSYRIIPNSALASILIMNDNDVAAMFKEEVVRAIHDMKAAVRFFRKSAASGNPYGINPDIIITGGESAGSIISDHVTYLDDVAKIQATEPDLVNFINAEGGLEGESGNPGYSSASQMSLSLCGAIMDTSIITAGQPPFFGVHTAEDEIVPYLSGKPKVLIKTIQVTLYGDSLIYKRALGQGINAGYYHYETGAHCAFDNSFFNPMVDFVYENVCVQGLGLAANPNKIIFSIYPNPSNTNVTIDIPGNEWNSTLTIVNTLGEVVHTQSLNSYQSVYTLDVSRFDAGIYHVNITTEDGKTAVKKLVVQ